ncbi:DUF6210 family protein [Kitasatospora sp. NPDC088134]|uniref:DUF6210 family protein n=1 Tax=Kitasatospora sp. NPDC088134 TaxID=3364071 RepID=UPI00381B89C2
MITPRIVQLAPAEGPDSGPGGATDSGTGDSGTGDGSRLYAAVEAPTGVVYRQRYGAGAERRGEVEGFLVPLFGDRAFRALRDLFEQDFAGAGTRDHPWTEQERAHLAALVGAVRYWAGDGTRERPHPLRLDEDRLGETDQAWVPVHTPDGPGTLLWCRAN